MPGSPVSAALAVERYFQYSLFLLLLMGFSTLALTGRLGVLSVLFVMLAFGVRGWLLYHDRNFIVPERLTSLLTIGYVGIYAADFFLFSHSFVSATIHLVLFSVVAKMFSVHRERDYVYLAILAFMMVLASAVLTVGTSFFIEFGAFALLAVSTGISLEMRRSLRNSSATLSPIAEKQFASKLRRFSGGIVVGLLTLATAIFVTLPRLNGGYVNLLAPQSTISTGFSDQVRLGEIGRIQQSDAVVMHVTFEGQPPADMRFRGVALTSFNGTEWSAPGHRIDDLRPLSQDLPRLRDASAPTRIPEERYSVVMQPSTAGVFFLLPEATALAGNYRQFGVDQNGSIYDEDREREITKYTAEFRPMPRSELMRAPDGLPYPPELTIQNLGLPAVDPRVRELAREITKDTNTNAEKAIAIERYLRTHYGYTLQLLNRRVEDPLAYFLFTRKQGHCEYFASSMAIMLRTLGIPARIVNGFRGGEYNYINGTYIVRAKNAHSWVEAYFPGYGWATFDPTPAAGTPANTALNRLSLWLDAASEFWHEWVINYDYNHQRELNERVVTGSRRTAVDWKRWTQRKYHSLLHRVQKWQSSALHAPGAWTMRIALLLVGVIAIVNLRQIVGWIRTLLIVRRPDAAPQKAASVWYGRVLRLLEKRGYKKPVGQTPSEFASRVVDPALRAPLREFTRLYQDARFGDSAEAASKLADAYEEVAEIVER
jgi:protein-glutamine gamma-glutamyltransferase